MQKHYSHKKTKNVVKDMLAGIRSFILLAGTSKFGSITEYVSFYYANNYVPDKQYLLIVN